METKSINSEDDSLLIVGATGWVGSAVLDKAVSLGLFTNIIGTGRSIESQVTSPPAMVVELVNLDLASEGFKLPAAKYLIYTAGSVPQSGSDFSGDWQEQGLRRALGQFFKTGGKRAIVLSSGAVYEGQPIPATGYSEDQWPAEAITATNVGYALVKQKEEMVVEEFRGLGHVVHVGRLFACIGPRFPLKARYAFVNFLNQYRESQKIAIQSPTTKRSYLHMSDLAKGLIQWVKQSSNTSTTVNLTGTLPLSLEDLAKSLFPEAQLQLGEQKGMDYYGNPRAMLSLEAFSGVMDFKDLSHLLREELQL